MLNIEGSETRTPRDALEEQETPDMHDEFAAAFGRVLAWLFQARTWQKAGGKKVRTVEHVGFRAFVLAYKLRPDLIDGMTFAEIGELMGQGRTHAHNLSTELSLTFGVRGRNEHNDQAKRQKSRDWTRSHPTTRREDLTASHLPIVNRFTQWQGAIERAGIDITDPIQADRLRRDFAPLIRFAQRLAPDVVR